MELIVRQAVTTKYQQTPITAPGTLRMFFHDCFVGVCSSLVVVILKLCFALCFFFGIVDSYNVSGDCIGM